MVFCFPSKRLRNLFSDDDHVSTSSKTHLNKKAPAAKTPATSASSSRVPQSAQLPPVSVASEKVSAKQPRIAIVIYSMYGHISSSEFSSERHTIATYLTTMIVAEAVKSGIETSGGSATIYQYVHFPCSSNDTL